MPKPTLLSLETTPSSPPTSTATSTVTPTVTRPPTVTPTDTSTPTPKPTLTREEQATQDLELLRTNGGCQLPCFWNIVPGQTLWTDFLDGISDRDLSNIQSYPTIAGTLREVHLWTNVEEHEGGYVHIYESDGIIKALRGPGISLRDAPYYQPKQILLNYGPPSRITINLRIGELYGHPAMAYYDLFFYYYDSQENLYETWFSIFYGGLLATRKGSNYQICPNDLTLVNKQNPTLIPEFTFLVQSKEDPVSILHLEEVFGGPPFWQGWGLDTLTDTTIDAFYQQMIEDDSACFLSPISAWPP